MIFPFRRVTPSPLRRQGGAAFIMVLSAILIMMLMASGFVLMVRFEIAQIKAHRQKMKAYYTAEAGLQVLTLRRAQRPIEPCSTTTAAVGSFAFPVPSKEINPGDKQEGTVTQVDCVYLDAATLTPLANQNNPGDIETIQLTAHASSVDSQYRATHSWFIRSPFSKAVWATGNLHFETSFPLAWCLVTFSLWCADDLWSITGKVFAPKRPITDWSRQCPPFNWFDRCRKVFLLGWRCCLLLKGCSAGTTCCCGFSKDTGARYAIRKNTSVPFHMCGKYTGEPGTLPGTGTNGYGGDCNDNGVDDEAEGESAGPAGSGWYFVRQQPTDEPFPQFSGPPDPRLPGSNTGLTWMTGPDASNFLKTNGYLENVWIDGDLDVNWGAFQVLGVNGVGIWGTVYVNGRLNYTGAVFSRLKLYAYPGWTNCIPGDMPAALCPGNKPPDDNLPGTLIVNKGDLTIESTGTPDLGRVNIVLIEGNRLELSSFCGMRSWGVYYVGGPLVDNDGNPDTPPIRLGGDIYLRANTRYGGLAEPLRALACDWFTGSSVGAEFVGQRHSEFHGAVIGNDVFFVGADKWSSGGNPDPGPSPTDCSAASLNTRSDCPSFLNIMDNPNLVLPLGFFNSIKAWNWRVLL